MQIIANGRRILGLSGWAPDLDVFDAIHKPKEHIDALTAAVARLYGPPIMRRLATVYGGSPNPKAAPHPRAVVAGFAIALIGEQIDVRQEPGKKVAGTKWVKTQPSQLDYLADNVEAISGRVGKLERSDLERRAADALDKFEFPLARQYWEVGPKAHQIVKELYKSAEAQLAWFSEFLDASRDGPAEHEAMVAYRAAYRSYSERRKYADKLDAKIEAAEDKLEARNDATREHNARMDAMRRDHLKLATCGTRHLEDASAACLARLHYVLMGR